MAVVHHQASCRAPLEVAFGYFDDYRNTPEWMFGITSFVPHGPIDHGLGAVFNAVFQVRPVRLHSTVEVIAWEQNAMVELDSVGGFSNRSRWSFEALGQDQTTLTVEFVYDVPGGIAGRALARALEPVVGLTVRHSDAALRRNIERLHPSVH
jgi:uncharacterized membrane protein